MLYKTAPLGQPGLQCNTVHYDMKGSTVTDSHLKVCAILINAHHMYFTDAHVHETSLIHLYQSLTSFIDCHNPSLDAYQKACSVRS
jgi:hypothetical protein